MNVSGVKLTDEQVATLHNAVTLDPDFGREEGGYYSPRNQIMRAVYDALPAVPS